MSIFVFITLSIFLMSISPQISYAFSEIPGLFIDEGTSTLARGGIKRLPENQEKFDFNSPLSLDSNGKIRSDVFYEHQRTYREYNGEWAGSHAYSEQLEGAVAAPFSLLAGKMVGSVAAGYGYNFYDVEAIINKEDVHISASERFSAIKGGLFLKAIDKVSLGVSLVDTDYRNRLEIPVEVNITPIEYVTVGYKRSYTDIAWNLSGLISGSSGSFPILYAEEKNEVVVKGEYKGIITAHYAQDLKHSENNRFSGRLDLPAHLYLAGDYTRRKYSFNQDFYVSNKSGGYLKGEGSWREYRLGGGADIGSHWNVEANYRRQNLNSSGGGIASSSAVVDFWPSLIVGNYNHLYTVALESDQYHLGAEYKGQKASFGIGCQYIDIKPVAEMTYWRSILFGLGKTGQETLQFNTDRIKLLFISLGTGYRWDKVSFNIAVGQFVPIEFHERDSSSTQASSGESSGGGGSSKDFYSQLKDFVHRNPGGNIVRFMVSSNF